MKDEDEDEDEDDDEDDRPTGNMRSNWKLSGTWPTKFRSQLGSSLW